MSRFYKLDENKNIIPCSLLEWGEFRENMRLSDTKHVDQSTIDGKWISTVFIGIDLGYPELHQSKENYKPLIFETMIFDNGDMGCEIYCDRYSTWQEAEEGHKKAIQWVKEGCK